MVIFIHEFWNEEQIFHFEIAILQHLKTSFERFHFSLRFSHLTYIYLYIYLSIYLCVCTFDVDFFLLRRKQWFKKFLHLSRKLLWSLHLVSHSKGIWTVKSVAMIERDLPKTELYQETIHSLVVKSFFLVTTYHHFSF